MKRGRLNQAASCQRELLVLASGCRGKGNDFRQVFGDIPTVSVQPALHPFIMALLFIISKRVKESIIEIGLFRNRKFCRDGPITIGQKFFRVLHNLGQSLQRKGEHRLDALGGGIVNNVKHTNAPSLRANGQHLIYECCNVKVLTTIL